MKYAEINKRFTNIINGYLANGYIFNSTTMGGAQGEVARVDLTNGKEIIRVMIDECWYNHHEYKGYEIFIGKAIKSNHLINYYGNFNTIWNSELIKISSEKYYQADYYRDKDWFVTEEEIKKNSIKRDERERIKNRLVSFESVPDKAKDIALKYVRRQPKCSRARKESIQIYKYNGKYCINYRNYHWGLK